MVGLLTEEVYTSTVVGYSCMIDSRLTQSLPEDSIAEVFKGRARGISDRGMQEGGIPEGSGVREIRLRVSQALVPGVAVEVCPREWV